MFRLSPTEKSALAEKPKIFLTVALTALTALCCLALAQTVSAKTYRFDYHKELEFEPGADLKIANSTGSITITGEEGLDRLIIEAVKTIRAVDEDAAREISEFAELKLSSKKNQSVIETIIKDVGDRQQSFWNRLVGADRDWFVSVDYVITVPRSVNLAISSSEGDIKVSSIFGLLDVSVTSGEVEISDFTGEVIIDLQAGSLTLRDIESSVEALSTTADIEINSLTGDLTVHGGSGDLVADYVVGDVTIVQTSGDVTLTGLQGDARIKVTSGKLKLQQESGALDVFTHTGAVTINTELFSEREFIIETLSGIIDFAIPDNAGAEVELSTLSGKIDTRGLPLEVESFSPREISGLIGAGGVPVKIKSGSGNIRLSWY